MGDSVGKACLEVRAFQPGVCKSSREEELCSPAKICGSKYVCFSSFSEFIQKMGMVKDGFVAAGCSKFSIKIPVFAIKIPKPADIKIPNEGTAEKASYSPNTVAPKNKDCDSSAGGIRCY